MAAPRSSFPLRLQQLLTGGRTISPSLKLESDPPPKVKAFIDRVVNCPLNDIAIPLSGFRWEYKKGNFHHWKPLFSHFETFFKTYIASRNDLLLLDSFSAEDLLPKNTLIQILRVMQIILENCPNKASFPGLEHLKLLLASTDPEILIATLEALCALVKVNPSKLHVTGKLIGCGSLNSHLLSLAQGWGSKEEGLGLYSCVVSNERTQSGGLSLFPSDSENKSDATQHRLGSTLHFECSIPADQAKSGGMCVIDIPDLHLHKEDDLSILKQCVEGYNVPPEHRFSLLTRIRYARAFSSARMSRLYTKISLLSFIVLVQSNDAADELVSFFTNEPEYTNELIRLVRSEDGSVPSSVRALAMLALGAQLAAYASSHERARILSGSSIISAGGNRMVLLGVLQKAILTLNNPTDPSSPMFVDALLRFFLFHVMSTSSSGGSVRASGLVPPLLPLLQDSDPAHMHLVCLAVKILQKLLEYSTPAVSLFKDLGGVQLLAQRLHVEVERVIGSTDEAGTSAMVISDAVKSDEDHLHSQKRLIKALLKALGTATYSPANPARGQSSQDNSNISLSGSLSLIFRQMERFGGDIYFSAVSLMSEMIHKDPTCLPALQERGLPDAFLSSVLGGVVPSSKALISIPNGLGAICLNTRGLESVRESSALRFLVELFTTRKYLIAMNEGVVLLANAVEELLRHQSSLRSSGVEIIIEILNKLSVMGEEGERTGADPSGSSDGVADMETDMEIKPSPEGHDLMGGAGTGPGSDGITDNQFIHLCVFHAMVLVHRTMENSESCRLFVEKGGIEILLKLLLRPSITQSSEGMPIALHSTVVFKGFTQHHSAPLARAFSSSLREHLAKALTELTLDPTSDNHSTPSLFVVEFLLFLAASKDNRWINALLAEFADAGKDVLENIGRAHRETLWQIALLEDSKVLDVDSESSNTSISDAQRLDSESDDGRLGSLRQYIDPLLRRRSSSWGLESQVSDLINIYRDISRVTGSRTDRYLSSLERSSGSSDRTPRSSESNPSSGSSTAGARTVEEKKSLSRSSYHDMLTSLSYHIDHLFMELGKAMLLSSRRENNPVNLPPSVVSVASTVASIVSEHLNFGGHARPNESEVSVTTKCRYLGKVLYFIDGILLDRPDSCNPIILNCFYSRSVIQLILTTFEATSQLLFAVTNRLPASPMETEDSKGGSEKDSESMWIYGPLASYGAVLDHLVTSSFILSGSTRQLLEQPIGTGSIQFPQDAEAFVKMLQSKVLKVVLPIWTHPHFARCNLEFVSALTSIMRHVYCGVEVKNTGSSNGGSRLAGPPPDESVISLIVEMGFPRARAEEALRQVGTNSVEIAMDWLVSHQEEPQEDDDDLARALAMSLGGSDSPPKEEEKNEPEIKVEEETMQLPPIDEMLTSCIRLLQMRESLAFPVRDMLVTICSQNDGQYRPKVLTFIIDRVREICAVPTPTGNSEISALFHVLALILHDDSAAREAALKAGLAKIALDLLSGWDVESSVKSETNGVPKWVTSCFLSIDQMLQVEPKLPDITELELGNDDKEKPTGQVSVVIDQLHKETEPVPEAAGLLDTGDQKRLLELCCRCMQNHVSSDTMHVVLQLCATLTKVHPVAVIFLEIGGLHALLSLPIGCLFPGFNAVAASIIRHILEDPHTLQQTMELEIRHCLITAANRNGSPRVTPRNFLQSLSDVISRDPAVFMQAARNVCQIDMVGDRAYIVQVKERDKEMNKEKEKEKPAEKDKADKLPSDPAKQLDSNTKTAKAHKKSPQSFVTVIEHLLDLVATFVPPPVPRTEDQADSGALASSSASDMDIDSSASAKGKGKAVATLPEESKAALQEATASVAKMAFLLKFLTDVLLTYASSINVLLRRDAELSSHGPGGVFSHIIHQFLSCCPAKPKKDKKSEGDWRYKMATRSSQFLVASAIRSAEARKRIFSEISRMLSEFVDSSNGCKAPDLSMNAYIDLLNEILGARSPTGSYISAEASSTFINVGLVQVLTRTLEVLDLDNSESSKVVTGIVKALELVTKEHVHLSDAKGERKARSDPNQADSFVGTSRSQPTEARGQTAAAGGAASHADAPNSVTDEMEHDYDGEDDFMQDVVADDRTENNDGISTVEITFNIRHDDVDQMVDDNDDDDVDEDESDQDGNDDDMSGDDDGDDDDRDEDDEDEDVEDDEDDVVGEHDGLEEDEDLHGMHQPETDPDEHEMDEEEFDEDMLEEDEDEDEEDEEGVILRLEEGINGINVFDHIEVLGGGGGGTGDTLRVMPLDIFGTRRHGQSGRTTSIYNLLGGRSSADQGGRAEHPLLEEPTALRLFSHHRQSDNTVDLAFSDRNQESSSRLDAIFRTLRSSRQGNRFNIWLDENHPRSGSTALAVPQGLEDLIISQLRRPTPEQPTDPSVPTIRPDGTEEPNNLQGSEPGTGEQAQNRLAEGTENPSETVPSEGASLQGDTSNASEQATDMQYERSDAASTRDRDGEAISQASSESGATIGESLRSLEVEIGSVEGHDDSMRRPTGGVTVPSSGLERVSEVPQNTSEEGGQTDLGPQEGQHASNRNGEGDSSIDPTFLEALPEDLRAEVLSSQQNQAAAQGSSGEQALQNEGEIDPEFLAALPPDIREEVLAQQRAQRLQQSQELEGQPVEMDPVSIIATFPSEIREEVLLTSPDTLLATLTPALVAEANMLRERFAHRYHGGTMFGMGSRSRRGESSRLLSHGDGSRQTSSKVVEADGTPLVDQNALKALIRLLRIVQPLYKGQLQRLLLNLCAHRETRALLVQILVDMLMLDLQASTSKPGSPIEPPFRLYGCQGSISYSRPQHSDGVPPLVSRRILETLTYLARNHPNVAKLLLYLELSRPIGTQARDLGRGKAVLMEEDKTENDKAYAIVLLLTLLNQPLYMRSVAHLEQLLNLLEVVMVNVDHETEQSEKTAEEKPSGSDSTMQEAAQNDNAGTVGAPSSTGPNTSNSGEAKTERPLNDVLQSLPQPELCLLCSLLAREGLSDNAYVLVAEVLKKVVAQAPTYCSLFITELAHSMQNLTQGAMNELRSYGENTENALLSASSTNGTAVLRVLQALSSLVSTLQERKEKEIEALGQVADINSSLDVLWLELSNCISNIESSPDYPADQLSSPSISAAPMGNSNSSPPLPAGTQNILPYIESFFVTCEKLRPSPTGQAETPPQDCASTTSDIDDTPKHNALVKFSEKHRKLLNAFIRQNPGLLEKSFSLMLKIPRLIDFDNKRAYFRSKIKHQHDHHHHSPVRISVRRNYILEDSYNQLRMRSPEDLKGRLTVHFQGEEGIDAGGLTREWYQQLSRVIFDKGALLFTTVGNESTFQPNPNSVYQTEHLSYFKFVGRVVGKALFDSQLLDVHFTRSFYKHILGAKVTYHDIEAIDPSYYKNLKWMLENDISDVLDLTFSVDADEEKLILCEKNEVTDYELIPGGRNIRVTEENKHEYVDRIAEHRLTTAIRPQINAFLEGFTELIPKDLISIFNDKELELLISGLPDIDLDDLRANTEYSGYSIASPVIQWFWEVVQGFSKEDKARFLQFVTGTSKVPLEGFSALQGISGPQRFQIHKAYGSIQHLPSAHTCFNQLDLPEYTSKEQLQERLLLAIHEGNEGFGFG
ncbi:hypothetical protein LUZ63_017034 [Rhynchospora breviuscula]|uniref:HECT-type E3 ubiquitin transferase n=1 Tax=Rhynchospora breviuscula TaxID=2022672 RepID=A0A9Q0C1P6_9POAL|nr:hypothetical protein LUZ63_017034 [Rhynchospora breviuscula]